MDEFWEFFLWCNGFRGDDLKMAAPTDDPPFDFRSENGRNDEELRFADEGDSVWQMSRRIGPYDHVRNSFTLMYQNPVGEFSWSKGQMTRKPR